MDFTYPSREGIQRPPLGVLVNIPRVPILGFWTFMEGGGRSLVDSSGNGYHASLANGSWAIAPDGPTVSLNGTSTVATGPTIPSSNTMWWMFRCTPNTVTGIHGVANKYVTSGTGRSWRIHTNGTSMALQVSTDGSGSEQQSVATAVTIGTTQTYLIAFNAGEHRLWRRAEPADVVTEISAPDFTATSIFQNTTVVAIGSGNDWFSGTMTFFAMGTGVISNALAVDMLRHPFADFEFVEPAFFVPASIGRGGSPLTGAFGALGGAM